MDVILVKGAKNSAGSNTGDDPSNSENTDFIVAAFPLAPLNQYICYVYCKNQKSDYAISFPQKLIVSSYTMPNVNFTTNTVNRTPAHDSRDQFRDLGNMAYSVSYFTYLHNLTISCLFKEWLLSDYPEKAKQDIANAIENKYRVIKTNVLHKDDYNTKIMFNYKKIIIPGLSGLYINNSSISNPPQLALVWDVSQDPERQTVNVTSVWHSNVYYDGRPAKNSLGIASLSPTPPFSVIDFNSIPSLQNLGISN